MSKRSNLRENIVVMLRNGDRVSYKLRLAAIRSKHNDGSPKLVEIIRNSETIDVSDPLNREFLTMYVPLEMAGDDT